MNLANDVLQVIDPDPTILKLDLESKLKEDFKLGQYTPLVWINDFLLNPTTISTLEINLKNFLPRIIIKINDDIDQFSAIMMPKKQDMISIMIKDREETFKPIKANFSLDSISTSSGGVSLSGNLFIPKFNKQVCLAYENKTSHEVLVEIATELGLGFATNEDVTNDVQNWIIPYKKYIDFLSNIKDYIYKEEELNYYEVFIDIYYNINLVNIPKLFKDGDEEEISETYASLNDLNFWDSKMLDDDYQSENRKDEKTPMKLFLTNMRDYIGNNNYFERFDFYNNTGNVYKSIGVNKIQKFYDVDDKTFVQLDLAIDFETDQELGELIVLDEEMDNFVWNGVIFPENHHLNYDWVRFQSNILRGFYYRNELRLTLNRANFYLHKFIKIPIIIFAVNAFDNDYLNSIEDLQNENVNTDPEEKISSDFNNGAEKDAILNKFVSGYYVLKDYKIFWDSQSNQYEQQCAFFKPLYVNVINKIVEN